MTLNLDKSKKPTLVTFLLDRSQSMSSIRQPTIDAFNAYLSSLKEDKGDGFAVDFTFLQFDSISLDKLYIAEPIKNVPSLTQKTFVPRGSTPLIDSCVKTIKAVAESLTKRDDKPKIVVCFQTDGEENVSTEHTWVELNQLIKEKTLEGWEFIFMGAGIDAYEQGRKMGISAGSTVSYDSACQEATMDSYRAAASNTRGFAMGQSINTSFTAQQKMQAGDKFDPARKGGVTLTRDMTAVPTPPDLNLDLNKKSDAVGKTIKNKAIVDDFDLNAKT